MRDNSFLLNCRTNICSAIKLTPIAQRDLRAALHQALVELDAFRFGALQRCESCPDQDERQEGP